MSESMGTKEKKEKEEHDEYVEKMQKEIEKAETKELLERLKKSLVLDGDLKINGHLTISLSWLGDDREKVEITSCDVNLLDLRHHFY